MLYKQNADRIVDVGQSNDISKSIKGKTMKKNEQQYQARLEQEKCVGTATKIKYTKTTDLKGDVDWLVTSETAKPTYFCPTSNPNNLAFCVFRKRYSFLNNATGTTSFIFSNFLINKQ